MTGVVLPELGEGVSEAVVSLWHFEEGNSVKEKDDLVEMATDKASFNLPAPCSGVLSKVVAHEGETVKVGALLAHIEEK